MDAGGSCHAPWGLAGLLVVARARLAAHIALPAPGHAASLRHSCNRVAPGRLVCACPGTSGGGTRPARVPASRPPPWAHAAQPGSLDARRPAPPRPGSSPDRGIALGRSPVRRPGLDLAPGTREGPRRAEPPGIRARLGRGARRPGRTRRRIASVATYDPNARTIAPGQRGYAVLRCDDTSGATMASRTTVSTGEALESADGPQGGLSALCALTARTTIFCTAARLSHTEAYSGHGSSRSECR